MRDALSDLPALLARTDELWIFSANAFGCHSPLVRRALERSIGYVHPGFRMIGGELHHRLRTRHDLEVRAWLYGPSTKAERAAFARLAAANAVNLGARLEGVRFPRELAWRGATRRTAPAASLPDARPRRSRRSPPRRARERKPA